jgi:DNA-binding NarL/FixJ family response regulator
MKKPYIIFLVDDDPTFLEMLDDVLRKNPAYKTYKLESGEACLECLHVKPDLVLLDHHFGGPGMNGLETLKKIKEQKPGTKVIMLTGQEDGSKVFEFINAGANDYVIKNEEAFETLGQVIKEYI